MIQFAITANEPNAFLPPSSLVVSDNIGCLSPALWHVTMGISLESQSTHPYTISHFKSLLSVISRDPNDVPLGVLE